MSYQFYFDVLPVHLIPRNLESLTSYLTRVAQENHIKSVDGITELLFPGQSKRVMRALSDFPSPHLEKAQWVLNRNYSELIGTTFCSLGAKFARSVQPQALSRFLSTSISSNLRYCPYCVAEKGYYSLLWRFNDVRGCKEHKCQLLEKCETCNSAIPLFKAPLRIGFCSTCGSNLANG